MVFGRYIPHVVYFRLKNALPFFQCMMAREIWVIIQHYGAIPLQLPRQSDYSDARRGGRLGLTSFNCSWVFGPAPTEVVLSEVRQVWIWKVEHQVLGLANHSRGCYSWSKQGGRIGQLAIEAMEHERPKVYLGDLGVSKAIHLRLCAIGWTAHQVNL